MDFSPVSDTYSEDSDQESSTSSEDGMQVIRQDLLRQRQAPSSSSAVENKYLTGFMRSPDKPLPDVRAKQALDKDPFSLISPLKQAGSNTALEEQTQRAGDSTGHGGSMSADHGTPSLAPPADAHLDGMQLAVDLIRAGSSSSSSQPADPIWNNSDVSLQVNKEKEVKPQAQRVLGEAFCITRLKEIRELAGDLHLRDFTDGSNRDHRERSITHLFRRFLRENAEGDPPFFCVSAAILGRLIHTFKVEHITQDQERRASAELISYVDEILQQSKVSLSRDAAAIRSRNQELMVRQNRLIESARDQAAAALEANHARMKDTMRAYEEALDQQLQTVLNSTITEDTLNQEMEIAARAHRDRIHGLTAIPPLRMDEDLLQLQTRCAILDQQAEDLQSQLRAYREQDAEGKMAILQRKVEELQKKLEEQADASEAMSQETRRASGCKRSHVSRKQHASCFTGTKKSFNPEQLKWTRN